MGSGPEHPADLAPAVRAAPEEAQALGLYRPPAEPRVAPGLVVRSEADPHGELRVWVFLTDKGIGTRSGYHDALAAFGDRLNEPTRRRRQAAGAVPDFTDLAVYSPYVEALAERGLAVHRTSRWLNAVSGIVPAGRLAGLAGLPFVRYVQPMLVKRGSSEPVPVPELDADGATPRSAVPSRPWGIAGTPGDSVEAAFYGDSFPQLDQIGVIDLQRMGYSGAGVRVLMLDTGFRNEHPAFARARIVGEYDFINDDFETGNEAGDYYSQDYHGTGTWGTLGGYAPGDLIGPAFAAEFLLAKTEDVTQEVHAEEDNYVAALEWGDTMGVDITSASLSYFTFDDSVSYSYQELDGNTAVTTRAVDLAAAKGICCVNAMGNSGPAPGTLGSPSDADSVVAVGAVDSSGVVANFSSRGPTADNRIKPEVVARGVNTRWARAWTNGYGPASGTSLSTPLIGGLAALLKEAHPEWGGVQIRTALLATASHPLSPDNDTGWGLASGTVALGNGAIAPSPPRMSLPFQLLAPPDSAVVAGVLPTLRWQASDAPAPGAEPVYHVLVSVDAAFSAPDTFVVSDTTFTFAVGVLPGSMHWWRVEAVVPEGYVRQSWDTRSFTIDASVAVGPEVPPHPPVALGPGVPNPARGPVRVSFRLPEGEPGRLDVVAVTGRLLRSFEVIGTGRDEVLTWDGRDEAGRPLSAGIYFLHLEGAGTQVTRKVVRVE